MLWRLQLIAQLNRFLALQALVECLGICIATFWSKIPNIVELGQIYAWYLSRWSHFFYRWFDRQFTNSGVFRFSTQ